MKRIVTLLLVSALVIFAMAGCGKNEQEKLEGTWEGQLDLTAVILGEVPETMQDLDVGEFVVTVVFTFTPEGTYTMKIEEDSATWAVENLVGKLEAYIKAKMEASAAEQGLTTEELAQIMGKTPEELAKELLEKADVQTLSEQVTHGAAAEGIFLAEEGKLYLSDSKAAQPNAEIYNSYTLEGDVLTITAATGGSEAETNILKLVYPIILKKTA